MAKLGLIFPFQDIMDTADKVLEETEADVVYKRVTETVEAVDAAREAVEAGAEIVISRGYQAVLIKRDTNIPVVELRLHAQDVGLLLKQAKEMVKTERPRIGLVVFNNMLCDMSKMEELFGVKLQIANIIRSEEIMGAVSEIARSGVDLFIGGEMACEAANDLGYPALLYNSSEESIREALREADRMSYAMEAERKGEAQFETVIDTTFNGIIKINAEGNITAINRLVENLIDKKMEEVVGLRVYDIFPEFDEQRIKNILSGKTDSYTVSVDLRRQSWVLLMAPIEYQDAITGAILSLQRLSEDTRKSSAIAHEAYLSGYTARTEFRDFHVEDEEMRQQIELAKRYALSDGPVLIYGEPGTEYAAFAEAIHNNSSRRNGPFVSIDLGEVAPEDQMKELFGEKKASSGTDETAAERTKAASVRANHGTLFIKKIELMTLQAQREILKLLNSEISPKDCGAARDDLIVRVIAYTDASLQSMVERGRFDPELFYLLQGMTVEIPPLRKRPDELSYFFQRYFNEFNKKYNKYLVYTNGAEERIRNLNWEGNHLQLRSFCERLVMTADKRRIDEVEVQQLYDSLYPKIRKQNGENTVVVYRSPEADELEELLEKHRGNRKAVAEELGISTTTLWRRMKKYNIE